MIFSQCCNYIYRFFFDDSPSTLTACYVTEFDTLNPDDVINSINIGGDIDVPLNIDVNDTIANIIAGIEGALGSASVTYSSVAVERTDIGGGLFSFIITIYDADTLINIIDISGTAYVFALTSCDVDFIRDGDNNIINDSDNAALVAG